MCRHGIANVFLPAFCWAQYTDINKLTGRQNEIETNSWRGPGVRFVHLTYKTDLATRHSVQCRQLIQSPWYQTLWGDRYQISDDENLKTHYSNTKGGLRISGAMKGVTGKGGNILIFDDPHDVMEGDSELARNEVIRFWTEQLPNRPDPGPAAFIVIMQRVHANDLSGFILANEMEAEYL